MKSLENRTVLVVDDEQDLREMVAFEFELRGSRVLAAGNGEDALDIVESESVDAVVTDIRMSGCDGIELLNKLRARNPLRPAVVFITAYDSDLSPCEAYRMGAEGIFAKPFSLKELVSNVERALVPPEQRWSAPPATRPAHTIECRWPDLDTPRHAGWFELGKGGLAVMAKIRGIMPGETVVFDIRLGTGPVRRIEGCGVVRWAKQGADLGVACCGIEFVHLSDECRPSILEWMKELQPKAFIPTLRGCPGARSD